MKMINLKLNIILIIVIFKDTYKWFYHKLLMVCNWFDNLTPIYSFGLIVFIGILILVCINFSKIYETLTKN
jgi:hypothetical protein